MLPNVKYFVMAKVVKSRSSNYNIKNLGFKFTETVPINFVFHRIPCLPLAPEGDIKYSDYRYPYISGQLWTKIKGFYTPDIAKNWLNFGAFSNLNNCIKII